VSPQAVPGAADSTGLANTGASSAPSPRERELVRAACAGDRKAFEALFDLALPRVRTMAAFGMGARMRSRLEIDDAVQEIFAEALKRFPQFDPEGEGTFFGWLREIARHRILGLADRELGRAKRDPRREARAAGTTSGSGYLPADTITSPTGAVVRAEALETLHRALGRLSEEHRRVVLLRCIEERSTAEAAALLGRTENATAVLLYRALGKLKEAFAAEESS